MNTRLLVRGMIAGLLGGTVLAIVFFLTDLFFGTPLATPAFMAEALLGASGLAGVPAYTVLHYLAFLVVGLATAWAVDRLRMNAPILVGLALGGFLFVLVFYGAVALNGTNVIAMVGWATALIGNLAAGLAMVAYCRRSAGRDGRIWAERVVTIPWVKEGIALGISTAALVALWMLLVDSISGRPFFTPGALGSVALLGASDLSGVVVNPTTVLGYTLFHGIAFVGIGIVVALGAAQAERAPSVILAALLLFAVLEALTVGLIALVASFLLGATAWWGILGGNLVAASWMAFRTASRHPVLTELLGRRELSSEAP
ncbi:MAG: hypothetical protein RQ745_09190 [Longimicrobiales bacterium]|nr:hypothetical protein [Longimicrobiales bacterium]